MTKEEAIYILDKFLDAFKKILDHGAYCQGHETKELDKKLETDNVQFYYKCIEIQKIL